MKIYLDVCCYNRPFDLQTDKIVHLEAEAVLEILKECENNKIILYKSTIVDLEISKIIDEDKKNKVTLCKEIAKLNISLNKQIVFFAKHLEFMNITAFDALHISLAQSCCDYFITTDKKLLKRCKLIDDVRIKIVNPVEFIMEVLND